MNLVCGNLFLHSPLRVAWRRGVIAGLIGSTLVDRLLGEGHQMTGADNLKTGSLTTDAWSFLSAVC
jgi:hypothetical protein